MCLIFLMRACGNAVLNWTSSPDHEGEMVARDCTVQRGLSRRELEVCVCKLSNMNLYTYEVQLLAFYDSLL